MGKQVLGNKKNENAFMFPKKEREGIEDKKKTPGPGSYNFFSEFGK